MAESNPQSTDSNGGEVEVEIEDGEKLKHLEFVRVAVMQAMLCLSSLYGYAKDNAGPLKPGVQSVEGTVKTVVGPVYYRLHDVPFRLLKFADTKVDGTMQELSRYVPSLVKQASCEAYTAAQKAPEVARSVASEVQRDGVIPTATNAAKTAYKRYGPVAEDLYNRYEPVAEKYAVATWRSLNRLPLFPQVAQIVVPTAGYLSDKYNHTVRLAAERGYTAAEYIPLIPKERIAEVFSDGGAAPNGTAPLAPAPTE